MSNDTWHSNDPGGASAPPDHLDGAFYDDDGFPDVHAAVLTSVKTVHHNISVVGGIGRRLRDAKITLVISLVRLAKAVAPFPDDYERICQFLGYEKTGKEVYEASAFVRAYAMSPWVEEDCVISLGGTSGLTAFSAYVQHALDDDLTKMLSGMNSRRSTTA